MNESEIQEQLCVGCGYAVDRSSPPGDDAVKLKAGDLSICLNCGFLTAYTADLFLRELELEEFAALDPGVKAAITNVQKFIKWRGPISSENSASSVSSAVTKKRS